MISNMLSGIDTFFSNGPLKITVTERLYLKGGKMKPMYPERTQVDTARFHKFPTEKPLASKGFKPKHPTVVTKNVFLNQKLLAVVE